jgi:hypothetical protein
VQLLLGPVLALSEQGLSCAGICRVCLQAGQTASQIVAPKSAPKGKKAAPGAMLSEEAQQAMALVEVAAAELPQLEESRWAVHATAHAPNRNQPCVS